MVAYNVVRGMLLFDSTVLEITTDHFLNQDLVSTYPLRKLLMSLKKTMFEKILQFSISMLGLLQMELHSQ